MKTPLYPSHLAAQARMVDFHGWEMPVWYQGITAEHMATRTQCGLFDVSHMGEFHVDTPAGVKLLNELLTIDVYSMPPGKVRYTFLLNEKGGIIDDLTVYCIVPGERYMLCVNSANTERDFAWIMQHNREGAPLEDQSANTAMLALQGPLSPGILKDCTAFDLEQLSFYTFASHRSRDFGELMISRTGYTGECGVEIFMDVPQAPSLWEAFLRAGATPCGLGARDTLRLEMGYPLHGNDITEDTTPLEAGLAFAVEMDKPAFMGREALLQQQGQGLQRALKGIRLLERGVPRQGYICQQRDRVVGRITSGSISPVLNQGIALAYLDTSLRHDERLDVMVRTRRVSAQVVKTPFVGTGK